MSEQQFPRPVDRRVNPRLPVNQPCLCHHIQPGEHFLWEAMIQNISAGGVLILAHRGVEKGGIVSIELPHRGKLFVRVRHTTRHGESYLIGCRFLNKLSSDELEAFLQVPPGWHIPRHPS